MSYVGRFAPSPSGPLHFGSLIKGNRGVWIRMGWRGCLSEPAPPFTHLAKLTFANARVNKLKQRVTSILEHAEVKG